MYIFLCIFIQNIIIFYETINGNKYTYPPWNWGFVRIDINQYFPNCIPTNKIKISIENI